MPSASFAGSIHDQLPMQDRSGQSGDFIIVIASGAKQSTVPWLAWIAASLHASR
jgi:hypothetical protein